VNGEKMQDTYKSQIRCFVTVPLDKEFQLLREAIKEASKGVAARIVFLEDAIHRLPFAESVYSEITKSDLVIAELSRPNPNTFYEIGLSHAMGKPVIFLIQEGVAEIPLEFRGILYVPYNLTAKGISEFRLRFGKFLEDFIRSPRRFRPFLPFPAKFAPPPYIVDLEKLDRSEFENLCFELISQMGFRRVEWGKEFREIDLVATLPKKDPDGYEYQELWLISMGRRAPAEMMLEMAVMEPEHFLRDMLRYPEGTEELFSRYKIRPDFPITILLILRRGGPPPEFLEHELTRMERRLKERRYPFTIRVRWWDLTYLTNLIQQYPQIAYKYFSEEARAKSKYRKTPEELYEENVKLTDQILLIKNQLEEEKKGRFIAERDAAWKDVAFKAAHKLGNPVYALETDLQNLKIRIETGSSDALKVANEMGISVEKAKTIIEQFKSLTKAQEINPRPIDLAPIIENACRIAREREVQVNIKIPENYPKVMGDPIRMSECFDELVANALHWLDKSEKKIMVIVDKPNKKELPINLERLKAYLRIRFQDNGCGVPLDKKEMIFAPFYTTHPHGTGLGLSLVQRIIEGHGGAIFETGRPSEGASFEIYLPIAEKEGKE
jgi:signal transduction histidine kinase